MGPAYYNYDNFDEPDALLYEVYMRSLERANDAQLEGVEFSLLLAGVFRGSRSLKSVLKIGMKAIYDFAANGGCDIYPDSDSDSGSGSSSDSNGHNRLLSVKEVHLCAFSSQELEKLQKAWVWN
mgnify:CR=1 FL=1